MCRASATLARATRAVSALQRRRASPSICSTTSAHRHRGRRARRVVGRRDRAAVRAPPSVALPPSRARARPAPGALMVPGSPACCSRWPRRGATSIRAHAHRVAGDDLRRRIPHRSRAGGAARCATSGSRAGAATTFSSRQWFGWTSLPWLWTLRSRTLVMAGRDDPIVPAINARIMQWLIPDARLEVVDSGHLFLVTRPEASARIVDDFLTHHAAFAQRAALRTSNPLFQEHCHERTRHPPDAVGERRAAFDPPDPRPRPRARRPRRRSSTPTASATRTRRSPSASAASLRRSPRSASSRAPRSR